MLLSALSAATLDHEPRDRPRLGSTVNSVGPMIGLAFGAIAGFVVRRRSARLITIFGTTALAAGTALTLVTLVVGSTPGYFAARHRVVRHDDGTHC